MDKKTWLIVGGSVLIVVVVVLIAWQRNRKQNKALQEQKNANKALQDALQHLQKQLDEMKAQEQAKNIEQTPALTDDFPLRMGSKGKRVEQLQAYLVRHFGAKVVANGIWDEATQQAVEKHLKVPEISENLFRLYNLQIIKTNIFK